MQGARILLVEDDAIIRELLLDAFTDTGFQVTEACDGEAAMELLAQAGFDLVLTDVHMPGRFDGVDVARAARVRCPAVPVVFATGRPETVEGFGALGSRAVCLAKPFRPSQVVRIVQKLLGMPSAA